MPMPDPIIEFRHVTAGYDGQPVVEDVSLKLLPGQFAGIIGPSGAGKTTILRVLLGTVGVLSGEVWVEGRKVGRRPTLGLGYVPQLETVDWNFPVTVEQVVLMGRMRQQSPWPWPSHEDRRVARELLERLGI